MMGKLTYLQKQGDLFSSRYGFWLRVCGPGSECRTMRIVLFVGVHACLYGEEMACHYYFIFAEASNGHESMLKVFCACQPHSEVKDPRYVISLLSLDILKSCFADFLFVDCASSLTCICE